MTFCHFPRNQIPAILAGKVPSKIVILKFVTAVDLLVRSRLVVPLEVLNLVLNLVQMLLRYVQLYSCIGGAHAYPHYFTNFLVKLRTVVLVKFPQ